ncbi:MAG: peptidylprolyl isomerase [Nocardioides sp.]
MRYRLLALPAALVLVTVTLASCSSDEPSTATDPNADSDLETTDCTYLESGSPAKEVEPPSGEAVAEGEIEATMATSVGEFGFTLDAAATPCTVHSFVSLAEQGYFDQTQCHRLTTGGIFVLQCGDPSATGGGGPGYSFEDELTGEETYTAGTLAMANSGPATNGSQFFIVFEDSLALDEAPNYTIFGSVDDATLEAVREVAADGVNGSTEPGDGTPNTEVAIESVTVD